MTIPAAELLLRRYEARSFGDALDLYEADMAGMTQAGYVPVATTWGWETEGSAGWLVGGSSWRPGPGTLAVTWRRDPRPASS